MLPRLSAPAFALAGLRDSQTFELDGLPSFAIKTLLWEFQVQHL